MTGNVNLKYVQLTYDTSYHVQENNIMQLLKSSGLEPVNY